MHKMLRAAHVLGASLLGTGPTNNDKTHGQQRAESFLVAPLHIQSFGLPFNWHAALA
jgi:hypothetical protein